MPVVTRVTTGYRARIDDLGERWRLHRSQVLAVVLPGELDRLGLQHTAGSDRL